MPDNKHFRFPAFLTLGLLLVSFFQVARVNALNITPKMMAGTDFRSYGLAQFAVHDYKLTREMVDAINFGLKKDVNLINKKFAPP